MVALDAGLIDDHSSQRVVARHENRWAERDFDHRGPTRFPAQAACLTRFLLSGRAYRPGISRHLPLLPWRGRKAS